MSFRYGIPLWRLQKEISSEHFTELKAYRNRNTLDPDLWFSQARVAGHIAASAGVELSVRDFVPINDPHAEERRQAQMRRAEEMLDRE